MPEISLRFAWDMPEIWLRYVWDMTEICFRYNCDMPKKNVRIIGFMVFKTIGSDWRFQRKNRFWKICTESRDIGQNMWNFAGLIWKADFGNVLADISVLGAYFSKPIFAFKPWFKAGRFEYHEPYNQKKNFFTYKGVRDFIEIASPQAKSPQKW